MTTLAASRRRGRLRPAGSAALVSLVVLAATGTVGVLLHQPWLFPSLGPTVMLFLDSPAQPAASPRNTLLGHGVGAVAGVTTLHLFGLQDLPAAPVGGLTASHVAAGALSVALTTLVLTALRSPHPPAGATTLIVSLGILTSPSELAALAGATVLVTVAGWSLTSLRRSAAGVGTGSG